MGLMLDFALLYSLKSVLAANRTQKPKWPSDELTIWVCPS